MKVLICAAGSGGHIYPALSLAKELKLSMPSVKIIFFCARKSIDKEIFRKTDYKVFFINVISFDLRAKMNMLIFFLKNFYFLIKFSIESIKVFFLINTLKPNVVVGFGGISSIAAILGAWMLRIPSLIHEQNVIPGKANRLLGRFAVKIAVGFQQSLSYFKHGKVIYTGNPIRGNLLKVGKKQAQEALGLDAFKFTVLVFGGSQGSDFINKIFIRLLRELPREKLKSLQIIHITGTKDNRDIEIFYRQRGLRAKVFSYCFEMSNAYSAADLVISRAGAGTVNEISFFGIASILIPYPYAAAHQMANAEFLSQKGAAFIIKQDTDCLNCLLPLFTRLLEEKSLRQDLAEKSHELYYDAGSNLAKIVIGLGKTGRTAE